MTRLTGVVAALITATARVAAADAAPAPAASADVAGDLQQPAHRLFAEALLAGTLQREGLLLDARLRYRRQLYESRGDAFRDNYLGVGLLSQNSPIFTQTGAYVELAPASFFRVTAGWEWIGYFGVLDSLLAMNDCESAATLAATDARCDFLTKAVSEPRQQGAEWGQRAWVEGVLQAKVGPVVAADTFTAERWWFRESWRPGGGYSFWFNEFLVLPQRRDDLVLTNSGVLLYEVLPDRGGSHLNLMVGLSDDLAYATGTDYLLHKAGLIAIARLPELGRARELAVVLLVQAYVSDRYLRGPMPFLGLVLTASTENLLPHGSHR